MANKDKDQYTAITNPTLYAAKIVGTAIHGAYISRGTTGYQRVLAECALASARYDNVLTEHVVHFDRLVGTRLRHKVDLICMTASSVDMFNVKSRGISRTDDPGLTVKTYIAARESMQREYPDRNVTYRVLRVGGQPIEEFDCVGVTTLDASEWASELCGKKINLENDPSIDDAMIQALKRNIEAKCDMLGLPKSIAELVLNMLSAIGNNCCEHATNLQVFGRKETRT